MCIRDRPAGIKVVLLDLFEQETYDNDLEILGKMFGKEKEASAFLKWKAEKIAILDRVKDLKPEQRVSVFTMTSSNFEKKKWSTRAKGTAPHQAIEMAGGINVARELSDNPEVSPEWILQQNPAALVFAEYSEDVIGFEVGNLENAEKFKEKVKNDKVFSKTDAVKKDQIYIMASDIFGGNKSYPVSYTHLDVYKRQGPAVNGPLAAEVGRHGSGFGISADEDEEILGDIAQDRGYRAFRAVRIDQAAPTNVEHYRGILLSLIHISHTAGGGFYIQAGRKRREPPTWM